MTTVRFPDGFEVPVLGQGTWHMGEGLHPPEEEARALQLGLDLGMNLIDTAEMYGDGRAEQVVARAIAGRRDEAFLVSKVYPHNANRRAMQRSCEASLRRLGTDRLDLYLLHWRGSTPLAETVVCFVRLREAGKIVRWGVSNLDVDDLEELGRDDCATDQVLYNLESRGIEFDLLPWCATRHMPVMAYSPVGQAGALLRNPAVREIAKRHGKTPAQIAIAWSIRLPGVISIPKAGTEAHVRENAEAVSLKLTPADLAQLDQAYPPPRQKTPLDLL